MARARDAAAAVLIQTGPITTMKLQKAALHPFREAASLSRVL